MRQTIVIVSMIAVLMAALMFGVWYIYETYQSSVYDGKKLVLFSREPEQQPLTDEVPTEIDPFGLFGSEEAVYEVTFNALWSDFSHPGNYSLAAHFSDPIYWTARSNPVFAIGQEASQGIEDMAETGITRELKQELELLQESGAIDQFKIESRVTSPGKDTYRIRVSKDNPVFSFVTMIAPSPDWFGAVSNLSLIVDGRWRDDFQVNVPLYDAGTEEGTAFGINNPPTDPKGVIVPLTDIDTNMLAPFASLSFKRIIENRSRNTPD